MQHHTYSTYHMIRKALIFAVFLAAAILPVQDAQAIILGVTAIPSNRNVAINRTASVSLTWKIVGAPVKTSVASQQGVFTAAGQTLGSVNTSLAATGNVTSVFIKEQLFIPASIVAKARGLGATQILYQRRFLDGATSPPGFLGSLTLNITGSAGAGFNISREALSFTDK